MRPTCLPGSAARCRQETECQRLICFDTLNHRSITMNNPVLHHSHAWIVFTYLSFAAALAMVIGGVVLMPLDLPMKGYLAMGVVMLIQSCITLTKTIRDNDEAGKLVNRIEDAKTERLLMDVVKGQP
jgi:hypothetical protein